MNAAKVISVEPGRKTLGEFNFSNEALEAVTRSIAGSGRNNPVKESRLFKATVNLVMDLFCRSLRFLFRRAPLQQRDGLSRQLATLKEITEGMDYRAYSKL